MFKKPTDLIKKYCKYSKQKVLVVGGGHGKEVKELLNLGHEVHSVDPVYTDPYKSTDSLHKYGLKIQDFHLSYRKYDIVVSLNFLQFLKNEFEKQATRLQNSLRENGILIIRICLMSNKGKFTSEYIRNSFGVLKPIFEDEYWVHDDPHTGIPFPHDHYIVDFVAQKV